MLISNLAKKKDERYEFLVKTWYRDLYIIAYWLCKERLLSEELVEETFIESLELLPYLDGGRSTKFHLINILHQCHVRKSVNTTKHTSNVCNLEHSEYSVNKNSKESRLQEVMWMLDNKYRAPLVMQVISGFDIEEIAQILGVNSCIVKERIAYARLYFNNLQTTEVI